MKLEVTWLDFSGEKKTVQFHQDDEEDAEALFCRMSSLKSVKCVEWCIIYGDGTRELLDQNVKREKRNVQELRRELQKLSRRG